MDGVAHHITQRGTDHQRVFYSEADRKAYLQLLRIHSREAGLRVLSYCLMTNHIHLVATPESADSLAIALQRAHGRYAQYLNARRGRSGHLWQNRFFSCALEGTHLWSAIRYVEQNPVRAGLVEQPQNYKWSSAAANLGGSDRFGLLDREFWQAEGGVDCWRRLHLQANPDAVIKALRQHTHAGQPLGGPALVDRWKEARKSRSAAAGGV